MKTWIVKHPTDKASVIQKKCKTYAKKSHQYPKTLSNLKNYQLAEFLPNRKQTSRLRILFRNQYQIDIVMEEKKSVQDGLYLVKTKVGWILSGRV